MALNFAGKNPYTGLMSKFSQEFQQFVKDLGDAKSKGEEDRIVHREADLLKVAIRKPGLTSRQQKEHIVRLIYCDMLGSDVSFSHMEAVKFAQQHNLLEKRVAYSAICLFLDEKNGCEYMMMNIGTVQRDLSSSNILEVCFGLLAASKVVHKDMMPAVLPLVIDLIRHKREVVRKKAVVTLLKFYEIGNQDKELISIFQNVLCDKDPAVMGASLNGFLKFVQNDPAQFKILVASFVSILKQIIEQKLPDEFNFKGVSAPWMQIKLLQILAVLGSDDIAMSKMMYEVLTQCLHSVDTEQGIGCAVIYECMKTIAAIYPNRALVEIAAGKAALFLVSDNYNLKYLGINALSNFINVDMSYGTRHQMVIIECLTDEDESIKRKTLDLLFRMTNGSNVKFICERLIIYLKSTVDEYVKSDLVLRITTLAEKYAPDNEWFIETMNEVFELGGDLVPVKVAYNMMAIIGEGIDEDEFSDDATEDLRRYAVISYISILDKPVLPDILVQLACWVVGEYLDCVDDYDSEDITKLLCKVLQRKFHDPLTQSWVISAIMKIVCRSDNPIHLLPDFDTSILCEDARQRYNEMKNIIRVCDNLDSVLPYDANCEDIEVDVNLSFLDDFVSRAVQDGADVYSPEKVNTRKSDEKTVQQNSSTLRFGAYEEPYRPFQKDSEVLSSPPQKIIKEKMNTSNVQETSPNQKGKIQKWTKEGYIGNHSKGDSSSSEVSTPASSETSSVKTEDKNIPGNITVNERIDDDFTNILPQPTKTKKEELAEQLFSQPANVASTRRRKGPSSRKSKTDNRKMNPNKIPTNLLDLDDIGDLVESQYSESPELLPSNMSDKIISNDPIVELSTAVDETVLEEINLGNMPFPADLSLHLSGLNAAHKDSSMFDMMVVDDINQSVMPVVVESNLSPANLLDEDILGTESTSLVTHFGDSESVVGLQDSNHLTIPEELRQYEHSPHAIELCSNHHLRVSCQYVYQPNKLSIVFFILNQSIHPLTEIQLLTKLPSNLKPVSEPVDYHVECIESKMSCLHVISVVCNSPAMHMVLSGNVIYRDAANTEKRVFLNHTVPMNCLVRTLNMSVDDFGTKWQNRSLYTKKGKLDVKIDLNGFLENIQVFHFELVKVIGNEIICAAMLLNKSEILLHFKLSQHVCDVTIKTESTLLNESLMKMISSAPFTSS